MRSESRRDALKLLGGLGAFALADCGATTRSAPSCLLDPTLTKGPYWIDERLNRSNIVLDTNNVATPNPRPGLPLNIQITVVAPAAGGCAPLVGAQVDVWHCDAGGAYSEVQALGTSGENFLRGYQTTDASGVARFVTIYPGWYPGRAVHVHVKVRLFDASGNVTTEATTQLFFDDSVTDQVFGSASPYNQRPARDTRNDIDAFYAGNSELLWNLQGDPRTGYTALMTVGVQVGAVNTG